MADLIASAAVEELLEAIRLTQEYAQLPAIEGWTWYDTYRKYRPEDAERLRAYWQQGVDSGVWGPKPAPVVDEVAAYALIDLRRRFGRPSRLGCNLVSHRDLGFCTGCHPEVAGLELNAWRLKAIAEGGYAPNDNERSTT